MSDSTKNYGFLTPGLSGAANITVQDGNWEKLDTELIKKVDKESGKCLSTNDFTDEEKQKLSMLFSQTLTPPKLTTTSAEGVAIGADGWTGTGWLCTSANIKYAVDSGNSVDTSISGFNRFCLRPATDDGEWQNWTPYFDYNGTAYEFFYAPGRGLYEALIPPNTQTAAQIVAEIRWENHPPTKLMYGKITNICGVYCKGCLVYDENVSNAQRYWVKSSDNFRNTCSEATINDYYAYLGLVGGNYSFTGVDINYLCLLMLAADVTLFGLADVMDAAEAVNVMMGVKAQLDIHSIDNF